MIEKWGIVLSLLLKFIRLPVSSWNCAFIVKRRGTMKKNRKNKTRFLAIIMLVAVIWSVTACGDSVDQGEGITTKADVEALFDKSNPVDYPTFKFTKESEENIYRDVYTIKDEATHATFNSIINNPKIGDERDFVRIIEKGQIGNGSILCNKIKIEPGKEYMVAIYIRNGATGAMNTKEHDYAAVARDSRVVVTLPEEPEVGVGQPIYGIVVASNTNPKMVWDVVHVTAEEPVKVSYVPDTARIYNGWEANGTVLSDELFTRKGVFIGLNELNGAIPGGEEYVCIVCFDIKVEAVG